MSSFTQNPRCSCALGGALAAVSNLHRTIPILHAGPGCGPQVTMGQTLVAGLNGPGYVGGNAVPSTNMYEREVVFGGEGRLRELIDTSFQVMDGDLYFVLSGCTSDIIGDDVKGIVDGYRRKGHAIAWAETAGFKGNSFHGYERVFEALLDQWITPAERAPRAVNLFGVVPHQDIYWQGNLEEITRLLRRLGLEVNAFFLEKQGIGAIQRSSGASLNLFLSPWLGEGIAARYEERFGVPALRLPGLPVGPTATAELLRRVGAATGVEERVIEAVVADETEYYYRYIERISDLFVRFRVAVIGDSGAATGITRFLVNDLGQTPKVVAITDEPREERHAAIVGALERLEFGEPPVVVFSQETDVIKRAVLESGANYVLGSSLDLEFAKEHDLNFQFTSFPVTDRLVLNKACAGIRGSLTLVEDFFSPI
jgi:nitrogenase molybdenum-iron protein beta chain